MTTILVDLVGAPTALDDLHGISHRLVHASPAFAQIAGVIERGEQRHFDRLSGKYVRSGDTKKSLTQASANGAIREVHSDGAGLTYGTKIWYAHFLKKPGTKKSAVLVLQPKTRKEVRGVLLDWIMGRGA